jgi:ParB family chromosome partitioning protein
MSTKQSDYLKGLLAEDEVASTPPDDSVRRSSPLLGRETALARIASGEVQQITQQQIDPARCRIWPGNARIYSALTEADCRDLIDGILAEGGQKVAAVVRRIDGDPDHDFEVIYGTRRHWSITWLRAHNYPELKFLVQVQKLDDETAFRLADLENRTRKDVSEIERARNYAWALDAHYGGTQARMAERLKLSKGWLSKMLTVAALPDVLISAFASLHDIQLKPAYSLAQTMDAPAAAAAIVAKATEIAADQALLRENGEPPLGATEVWRRLAEAPKSASSKPAPVIENNGSGRAVVTVMSANRQGVTLKLHAGTGLDHDAVIAAVRKVLDRLEKQKRGLQR